MSRQSTGKRAVFSASNAVEALAAALRDIKAEDRLTYADIGAVLGKSEDQAAKYADGTATMDAVTYGRARREWGKRFTCHFDQLCGDVAEGTDDRRILTTLLNASVRINECLENDDEVDEAEIRANFKVLSEAFDALGGLLQKVAMAPYVRGVK